MDLLIPPGLSFWQALQRGLVKPIEAPAYLVWVRTLPCCICGRLGVDAHHIIGGGLKGTGTRTPDFLAMPLCRPDHAELHRGHVTWETNHGLQMEFAARTMLEAVYRGELVLTAGTAG
jgi:hypothetical protein